jgi:hypothetical protein
MNQNRRTLRPSVGVFFLELEPREFGGDAT